MPPRQPTLLRDRDVNELPQTPPAKRPRLSGSKAAKTPSSVTKTESSLKEEDAPQLDTPEREGGLSAVMPTISENDIDKEEEDDPEKPWVPGEHKSVYVQAFDLALDTVLEHESHLFSEEEMEIFGKYRSLSYEAQYLYIRLFLRKTAAWFRLDKIHYDRDITDVEEAAKVLLGPTVGFAEEADASNITLDECSRILSLDELKTVAKGTACTGSTKAQLMASLKRGSGNQSTLGFGGNLKLSVSKTGSPGGNNSYLINKILEVTGRCIRLTQPVSTLFNRLHVVFYRSTEYDEKSLKTIILSRMRKLNFPEYIVCRTSNLFSSRAELLAYEEAIKLQLSVDDLLQNSGVPTKQALEQVLEIFESVYPKWQFLMDDEKEQAREIEYDRELQIERAYLRRFTTAWVLTRIVHKGVYVLGRFKQHAREHEVLTKLLAQKDFHKARRGGWYIRKALVEEHYMASVSSSSPSEAEKKKWRQRALETCIAALQDPDTHLSFHYDLQKRLNKLEKKQKIAKKDQHDFGHAQLRKPTTRTVTGVRLNEVGLGRKTIWRGNGGEECSVEELCLDHYRMDGWKGYHCEGRIVRTLFAYLFFDIMFLFVPNVFETAFQTCPLDLFTDAFYTSRASEINHRLVEISNGQAGEIIERVDSSEREKETCVVGLSWDYTKEEVLEIAECIGGDALSTICKILCQEYKERSGGMPDLFLLNYEKKDCMFVEVKSENDHLSDTQRLWIHALSTAGLKVELCACIAQKENEEEGKSQ
ncbi:hypothetical protein BJ508DRAFT_419942 [Ascobolus immersus RN42]|uniref:Fanconi-associated nuclease n=1 Tax=Ascobolus immersus RN42 TaxID=1160509 RepID=A0A3N4HCB4_ASCIM|nr:hypothetical protein BJ508DRAFT_419942 [Ascobolus immersus RN42]